jgi:hypothetical protein
MEAASTSEKSVNFYQTTRPYNPEDSRFHTHSRENLKSYLVCTLNQIFVEYQIKEDELCRAGSAHGEGAKCVQNFG